MRAKYLAADMRVAVDPSTLSGQVVHYAIPILEMTGNPATEDVSELESGKLAVETGDVLVSRLNPRKGRVYQVQSHPGERILASGEFVVFRPSKCDGRYLSYFFQASEVTAHLAASAKSATRSHQRVEPDLIRNVNVSLVAIEEQQLVAAYLDRETAQIDELIAKQDQLIATLAERRQAVITQALTRGLDVAVALVDSRSPWLGTVPAHWITTRLKFHADVQTGLTLGKSVSSPRVVELPYLRVANVQVGHVNLDHVKTVAVDADGWKSNALRSGDVLMTEGGDIDKLGRGSLWLGEIDPCLHQNHIFAVRCRGSLLNSWLVYALDAPVAREYFRRTAKKTTNLASTNSTTLGALPLALPPIAEQAEVVAYLDLATKRIDLLSTKATRMIALLKERRQALISGAVTGKIDVRERAASA